MLLHSAACGACLTGSAARATIDHPSKPSPNAMITPPSAMPVLISRVRDRTSSASCSRAPLSSASEAIVPPCARRRPAWRAYPRRPRPRNCTRRALCRQPGVSIDDRGNVHSDDTLRSSCAAGAHETDMATEPGVAVPVGDRTMRGPSLRRALEAAGCVKSARSATGPRCLGCNAIFSRAVSSEGAKYTDKRRSSVLHREEETMNMQRWMR